MGQRQRVGCRDGLVTGVARGHITIVGLGPGGPELVTQQTLEVIGATSHRFLRTTRHPSAALVSNATSFDDVYEAADTFADVYAEITERLVDAASRHGDIVYAVPGSPWSWNVRCSTCATTTGWTARFCRPCHSSTLRTPCSVSTPSSRRFA